LLMADQISAYINTANTTPNTVLSGQKMKDMFNNVNNYFTDSSATLKLNTAGIRLSDYASPTAKTDLNSYFDSIALYSQSAAVASNGVAGVATSAVTAKKLLLSSTGIFYSQVVKKIFQHGIFGYVIINRFMTDSVNSSVDNTTVIAGSGTKMEHNWDQAFGFFGVPVTFPTVTTGVKYLGSYCNQVDAGLHSNSSIMNAFLKGRAAISAKDLTTKNTQAQLLITTLDTLNAAAIVQEMKETDAFFSGTVDLQSAYGTLSEALGFVRSLKYNTSTSRVITDAQITQLLALFDSSNPNNPNLYNFANASLSIAQIEAKTDAIRQFIGKVYGFSAAELALL
jgi:hypothetical protein